LSNGPSTQNRWITRPYFRTCSTCRSRSQAPLCPCTLQLIADQLEGTFGRLRYLLGGDRPSQTAHQTLSCNLLQGSQLGSRHTKSGIPRLTPPRLAPQLQSLPPILHKMYQNPISGCSKGSRGLSVLLRVTRIFTGTTISPSPSLRQRPSRYAIRAGRNLPDKEFRYLRTVIVTAAVYWGFGLELCDPKATNPSP
jgi:hypothetical protein